MEGDKREGNPSREEGSSKLGFPGISLLSLTSSSSGKYSIAQKDTALGKTKGKRKLYCYAGIAMVALSIIALALGLGLGISSANAKRNHTQHECVVNLGYTSYSGYKQDNGVSYWRGMRYAAPPTGGLRFAAPQDPWFENGVQDATQVCPFS